MNEEVRILFTETNIKEDTSLLDALNMKPDKVTFIDKDGHIKEGYIE